ncbi:phage terminase small subunit-related protein [Cytobacillus praedii]|nr:phage terminase small subunit-related protein [Cytobacillus praedii]
MHPKGNRDQAYQDYKLGMKYKDIAEKYEVSLNTVKSWCLRYNWKEQRTADKSQHLFIKRLQEKGA